MVRSLTRSRPTLYSDPAWEAVKAGGADIDHALAVQQTDFLHRQYCQQWSSPVPPATVDLVEILRTLTRRRIAFVLTGTHGISGWTGRPRATLDVDILVKKGNRPRAAKVIAALYPDLELRDFKGVTCFLVPGGHHSLIDVTSPHRADIEETLAHPVWVEDRKRKLRYRVPSLEAALANKYGAILTTSRNSGKRLTDASDFTMMVQQSLKRGKQPIDLKKLRSLGRLIWPGGGEEIVQLVEHVKAGGLIDVVALSRGEMGEER